MVVATQTLKVDLGCGLTTEEGFIGVDISPDCGADVVHDLWKMPWPFEDDSVDEAFCCHVVEHTPDLIAFMEEVHRILKPGAKIKIVHPFLRTSGAFQDPTHTRFIPAETWNYFNREWRVAMNMAHYPIACDFELGLRFYTGLRKDLIDATDEEKQLAIEREWNAVHDYVVELWKKESSR